MRQIRKVAIVGASGTIGSLTGGLIAQSGIPVHFLSRTVKGAREGLQRAIRQARSDVISRHVECSDYEHGLARALNEVDLIIESVSEDIDIKQRMYSRVERHRRPGTILGTTTSSLPLSPLVQGRTDDFRAHFLSTHFYNPPGRMLACEIAKTEETDSSVYEAVLQFLEQRLQRIIVPVHNIPAYAGNRIVFTLLDHMTHLAERYGVEMVDYLVGPYTGRVMAPLATVDLVGLDVHSAIIKSLKEHIDGNRDSLVGPEYVGEMVSRGLLGRKSGQGFYKLLENGSYAYFDPRLKEYVPGIDPHVQFVERAKQSVRLGMYKEAFDVLKAATGYEADIVTDMLARYLFLAFSLVGKVTAEQYGIEGIDRVMAFGFNWAPPSVLVYLLGGREATAEFLAARGFEQPTALHEARLSCNQVLMDMGRYFVAK